MSLLEIGDSCRETPGVRPGSRSHRRIEDRSSKSNSNSSAGAAGSWRNPTSARGANTGSADAGGCCRWKPVAKVDRVGFPSNGEASPTGPLAAAEEGERVAVQRRGNCWLVARSGRPRIWRPGSILTRPAGRPTHMQCCHHHRWCRSQQCRRVGQESPLTE